jgi:hypothetical protein
MLSMKNIATHPKDKICNKIYGLFFNWILHKDKNIIAVIIDSSTPIPKVL